MWTSSPQPLGQQFAILLSGTVWMDQESIMMSGCQHYFLVRNKLVFLENWKCTEFGSENIQVASFDSGLYLVSCPCTMKLEKSILGPNLHLRFYYVLPALGQYLVLVHLYCSTLRRVGLCSPTHSLTRRIGWKIGLIIGFLFLFLSPLFLKIGHLKLE